MSWADALDSLKRHPIVIAVGLLISGALGFASVVAWLDGRIEAKIKTSDFMRDEVGRLRSELASGSATSSSAIPQGAVLAFDLSSGCPAGWVDLAERDPAQFAGRTVLAAGIRASLPFRTTGGVSSFQLMPEHLPAHDHHVFSDMLPIPVPTRQIDPAVDKSVFVITTDDGKPDPFQRNATTDDRKWALTTDVQEIERGERQKNPKAVPTLPPFVALYLCRKE